MLLVNNFLAINYPIVFYFFLIDTFKKTNEIEPHLKNTNWAFGAIAT